MKSRILFLVFLCSMPLLLAQQVDRTFFKAGFHGAVPLADASDQASFSLGVDIYHHWGVTKTIDLGLATGFTNAFLKDEYQLGGVTQQTSFDNVQYLPVAAFFRFYSSLTMSLGCDVGYAFGVSNDTENGLYYRPTLNFDVSQNAGLYFSYTSINNNGANWATVTGGILFLF